MWMVKHIKQALPHAGHICLLKKNHFSNDFIVGQFCGIGGSIFFQKTFLKQLKKFRSIEIFLNKPKFQLSHEFLLESVHYNFVQKIRQHNAFHITSHSSLKFPAIIGLFWLTASLANAAKRAGNFKLKWLATWKALCYLIFWTKL